jgi:integrase
MPIAGKYDLTDDYESFTPEHDIDPEKIGPRRGIFTSRKGDPASLLALCNAYRDSYAKVRIRGGTTSMPLNKLGGAEAQAMLWFTTAYTAYGHVYGVKPFWNAKLGTYSPNTTVPLSPAESVPVVLTAANKFYKEYTKRGMEFPGIVPDPDEILENAMGAESVREQMYYRYFNKCKEILRNDAGVSDKILEKIKTPRKIKGAIEQRLSDFSTDGLAEIGGQTMLNLRDLISAEKRGDIGEVHRLNSIASTYKRARSTGRVGWEYSYEHVLFCALFDIDYRLYTQSMLLDYHTMYLPGIRKLCIERDKNVPKLSGRTYYNIAKGMTGLFKFMADTQATYSNPLAGLRLEKRDIYNTPPYYIEISETGTLNTKTDEVKKLYEAIKNVKQAESIGASLAALSDRDRLLIMIRLFRETGARPANLSWLRWGDIKIERGKSNRGEIDWTYVADPEHVLSGKFPPKESHLSMKTCDMILAYIEINKPDLEEYVIGGSADPRCSMFPRYRPHIHVAYSALGPMFGYLSDRLIKQGLLTYRVSPLRFRKSFSTLVYKLCRSSDVEPLTGDAIATVADHYTAFGSEYAKIEYTGIFTPTKLAAKIFQQE